MEEASKQNLFLTGAKEKKKTNQTNNNKKKTNQGFNFLAVSLAEDLVWSKNNPNLVSIGFQLNLNAVQQGGTKLHNGSVQGLINLTCLANKQIKQT